jgi:hypothetical protein
VPNQESEPIQEKERRASPLVRENTRLLILMEIGAILISKVFPNLLTERLPKVLRSKGLHLSTTLALTTIKTQEKKKEIMGSQAITTLHSGILPLAPILDRESTRAKPTQKPSCMNRSNIKLPVQFMSKSSIV